MGFKLEREPIDMQLTVHINNMIDCEWAGLWTKKKVLDCFVEYIENNNQTGHTLICRRVKQIVDYYGHKNCINFLHVIYGINLRSKVA